MNINPAPKRYGTLAPEKQKKMSGLEFARGLVDGTVPLNTIAQTLGYEVTEAASDAGSAQTTVEFKVSLLRPITPAREQAYRDVEFGIEAWLRYFQQVAAFPQMVVLSGNVQEMIDFVNNSGVCAIGTVDDCAAQIERLLTQSNGFGAYLLLAHEWANPAAIHRSYELIARYVMPYFQGSAANLLAAKLEHGTTRPYRATGGSIGGNAPLLKDAVLTAGDASTTGRTMHQQLHMRGAM